MLRTVFLIRHADAGDARRWELDDALRPLSDKGNRQATKLAKVIELGATTALVSSPALRCISTVQPLADELGLKIEQVGWLSPGSNPAAAFSRLIEWASDLGESGVLAACSHGDILDGVVSGLEKTGVEFLNAPNTAKAAVITIVFNDEEPWSVSFRSPP